MVLALFFKLKASIDAFLALVRIFLRLACSSKFQIAFRNYKIFCKFFSLEEMKGVVEQTSLIISQGSPNQSINLTDKQTSHSTEYRSIEVQWKYLPSRYQPPAKQSANEVSVGKSDILRTWWLTNKIKK